MQHMRKYTKCKSYAFKIGAAVLALTFTVSNVPFGLFAGAATGGTDYTQFVDPFVATQVDNGQQFPGAVAPYGIVKLSADTYPHVADDHSGYDYAATQIAGFSHTRIEGVGGQGAGGDVLITPTYVQYTGKPSMDSRAQTFSHADESASPGYYSVSLTPKTGANTGTSNTSMGKIKAEMTTTTRTGFHKYTFPAAGDVSLVLDLNYTYHGTDIRDAIMNVSQTANGNTAISGRFSAHNVSGHGKYTMYFYMETDTPATSVNTWNGNDYGTDTVQSGNDLGAVLGFNVKQNQAVQVKVAISPISSDQAKIDMANEDAGWNFDTVRQNTKASWNAILGKVDITTSATSDPDGSLKKLFYTHLYRMFTTPVNATSTSGTYRGTDGKVYEAKGYTHYDSWTLWDDFHKYPMIGLICPDIYKDIIHSVADMLVTGISTWGNDTQPVLTVRNEHAVALLADGVAKGYTDIGNLAAAYEKAKAIADSAVTGTVANQGYFTGRVDQTVEYAYDDWALSIIANQLGKTDEANSYLDRSFNYKNLYKANADTNLNGTGAGLLWPKDASGNWMTADPEQYGNNGLYQGTLWQYSWWDTNDVGGLMDLMGGKSNMQNELETLFGAKGSTANGKLMLHSNTNEIDLQTPYLFNYAGKPSETQYWVRQIYTGSTWNRYSGTGEYNPPVYAKVYKLAPDGLMQTMDDDAGTMATMFVSAAMGLYAMTPGDTTFQIGSPFFEKMTLDLGNGKTFTINANGVSPNNYYIQSATLNGSGFNRTWLDYSEISRGGELTFTMGSQPSTWAENGVPAKSSTDTANTSMYSNDPISYSTLEFDESANNDGSVANSIDIKVSGTTIAGNAGDNVGSKVSFANVPSGLTAAATKLDNTTVRVSLTGKAAAHTLSDSSNTLQITLGDSLFAGAVTSANKVKTIRVQFKDTGVQYNKDTITATDGNVSDTLHCTLTGGAKFSGNLSDIHYVNLPAGVTVTAAKVSDTELSFAFSGKITGITNDYMVFEPVISLGDGVFADGVKAANVDDSTRGGMDSLKLENTMAPTSISVTAPTKTNYVLGEPLNLTGGAVTINYSDAALKKTVPLSSSDVTVGAIPTTAGDNQAVTVTYGGKNATFAINVNALKVDSHNAILHYDFNNSATGAVTDTTGNGYDGTLVNGASVGNGSLVLNGSRSQYLDMPVGVLANLTGDATMSAWVNVTAASNNQTLLTAGKNQQNFLVWVTNNVIRSGLDINNQGEDKTDSGTAAPLNQWIYLTYVQKGNTVTLYLNGQAVKSGAAKGALSQLVQDGAILRLGGSGIWPDPYTTGKIGDFTIYNKALTAGEIASEQDRTKNVLPDLIQTAQTKLDDGGYTLDSLKALQTAVDKANAVLKLPSATMDQIDTATSDLQTAVSAAVVLTDSSTNYGTIQFESKNDWSGGALKTESSTDSAGAGLTDLGGTYDGAWVKFNSVSFSGSGADKLSIRYCNNSGRCGTDSRIDIYLDNMTGTPVDSISLPVTGSNWNAYAQLDADLTTKITGTHDLYIVLHSTTNGSFPYVGNFDWISFSSSPGKSLLQTAYNDNSGLLTHSGNYLPADFTAFQTAMTQAKAVIDKSAATSSEIFGAQKALNSAVAGLHPVPDKTGLQKDADDAAKIDTRAYTSESVAAFSSILTYANGILSDDASTQADVALAVPTLQSAVDGLAELAGADKDALLAVLSQANAVPAQGYTANSFQALATAITAAQSVAGDAYASQAAVDAQVAALKAAMTGLKAEVPEPVTVTDGATDIQVIDSEGILPEGASLQAAPVASGSTKYQQAEPALNFDSQYSTMYDIAATVNNANVQLAPGQLLQISVPVPANYDKDHLAVYFIEADGSRTLTQGHLDGGNYVFNADRFGTFVLVQKKTAGQLGG